MHLKFMGYTDTALFPSTGRAEDVLLPYFGKSGKSISVPEKFK